MLNCLCSLSTFCIQIKNAQEVGNQLCTDDNNSNNNNIFLSATKKQSAEHNFLCLTFFALPVGFLSFYSLNVSILFCQILHGSWEMSVPRKTGIRLAEREKHARTHEKRIAGGRFGESLILIIPTCDIAAARQTSSGPRFPPRLYLAGRKVIKRVFKCHAISPDSIGRRKNAESRAEPGAASSHRQLGPIRIQTVPRMQPRQCFRVRDGGGLDGNTSDR